MRGWSKGQPCGRRGNEPIYLRLRIFFPWNDFPIRSATCITLWSCYQFIHEWNVRNGKPKSFNSWKPFFICKSWNLKWSWDVAIWQICTCVQCTKLNQPSFMYLISQSIKSLIKIKHSPPFTNICSSSLSNCSNSTPLFAWFVGFPKIRIHCNLQKYHLIPLYASNKYLPK